MSQLGTLLLLAAALVLAVVAYRRHDGSLLLSMNRALEQGMVILPRMLLALIAASFMVRLIPTEVIARYLGTEAGFTAVIIGSVAGLIVPSGPVVAFAFAAAFAGEGASLPALISFVTAWSVFATHRVVIFELPMLGSKFVQLRLLSVLPLPLLAGAITMAISSYL